MAQGNFSESSAEDALAVRAMLLQDPYNVALRRRYLSLRTPELLEEDRGKLHGLLDFIMVVLKGMLLGWLIGLVVWGVSWCFVAMGWGDIKNPRTHFEKVAVILRNFSDFWGLSVTVVAFTLTTGLFALSCALKANKLGRIAAELGPLPEDAPDDLTAATKLLLEEKLDHPRRENDES